MFIGDEGNSSPAISERKLYHEEKIRGAFTAPTPFSSRIHPVFTKEWIARRAKGGERRRGDFDSRGRWPKPAVRQRRLPNRWI